MSAGCGRAGCGVLQSTALYKACSVLLRVPAPRQSRSRRRWCGGPALMCSLSASACRMDVHHAHVHVYGEKSDLALAMVRARQSLAARALPAAAPAAQRLSGRRRRARRHLQRRHHLPRQLLLRPDRHWVLQGPRQDVAQPPQHADRAPVQVRRAAARAALGKHSLMRAGALNNGVPLTSPVQLRRVQRDAPAAPVSGACGWAVGPGNCQALETAKPTGCGDRRRVCGVLHVELHTSSMKSHSSAHVAPVRGTAPRRLGSFLRMFTTA